MFSSASIGGATFDLFLELQDAASLTNSTTKGKQFTLPIGAKLPVKTVNERYGGGAANTAVGFSRLGWNAHFLGVIADDQWGQAMQKNLSKERVNISGATIIENEVSGFSIILQANTKDRTILNTPGSNVHLHDAVFDTSILRTVDCIMFNRIQKHSQVIEDDIIATVKEKNVFLSWNPGGQQIGLGYTHESNSALLQVTSLLQLNKEEAFAFTNTNEIVAALKALEHSGVRYVCITDGNNGSYGLDTGKHEAWYCDKVVVEAVDSTGAGDAFGTGATWALMQKQTLPEALQAGSIQAAKVVQCIGAQPGLLTDIELRQKLQHNAPSVSLVPLT